MPRAFPNPELLARALELVDLGCSYRDAAETLGVTAPTIQRWVKIARQAPSPTPVALPEHMRPAPVAVTQLLDVTDPVAAIRQLIQEQHAAIQADRAASNPRGAASNAATLERLMKTLKQLEQANTSDAEVLKLPRAELALADQTIEARIAALAARGEIRCCDCSRALSVEWGLGGATLADPAAKPIIP